MASIGHRLIDPIYQEHFTGCSNEYLAAAYFLKKGKQIYWPSVQQTAVDFVVGWGKNLKRVQVKTATWTKSGGNRYLQCRTRQTNKYVHKLVSIYDLLVIVHSGDLWIIPSSKLVSSNLSLAGSNAKYRKSPWDRYRVSFISNHP